MTRSLSPLSQAIPAALLLALAAAVTPAPASAQAEGAEPSPKTVRRAAAVVQERSAATQDEIRPFFEDALPEPLRRVGPRGVLWWQWLALPLLALVAIAAGAGLGYVTRRVLGHVVARTRTVWDDVILRRMTAPLALVWAVAVASAVNPWLALGPGPDGVIVHVLRSVASFALFWGGFRALDVAFAIGAQRPWTRTNPSLASLLPLGRRVGKALIVALGLVAVLTELGFNVASLLAGLGIGGLALALAAQKTVENMFGSLSIGLDQPFREGDFVKIEDVTGTVEAIGMRSTRIRTLDRTIVTFPNGKLSETRAETFAARDRLRLFTNLGLGYDTTAEQMRTILREIEEALRAHPKIWAEAVPIRFTEMRDSTLNVEVVAWFTTSDWNEFTLIRQELFLKFMEIVERAGASFAFPTQTIHLVEDAAPPRRAR
jgi:MscS family membrane protein